MGKTRPPSGEELGARQTDGQTDSTFDKKKAHTQNLIRNHQTTIFFVEKQRTAIVDQRTRASKEDENKAYMRDN